jgi:hypothetical protein
MTHDELLEELNEIIKDFDQKYDNSNPYYKALLAVVELHKPFEIDREGNYNCQECEWGHPCQTIQAIKRELA